ncbi:MAG: PolC-type DNA polymerase III N-terminal domain-containing protein [Candidatus Binatia bacterium]
MIDVLNAVQTARNYLGMLYGTTKLHDVQLEEVELSDDGKFWLVTLGFSRPLPAETIDSLRAALTGETQYKREYKIFKIDSEKSEVQSMKIREV